MRVVAALSALLLLAGCDLAGSDNGKKAAASAAEDFGAPSRGYDYRYAYRLPGEQLKAVLQSNADACDKLTPTRCRILSMRYKVDGANKIRAMLMITIDPAIARTYGEAVTKAVTGVDGVLVDTEVTGADSTSSARGAALIKRLQDQLANARSQAQGDGGDAAKARADRLQTALDAIAEVEAGQGQSLANAPVLLTYESSSALTGLGSAQANFRNAGHTLESSVARLLTVLAAIGPWMIALILIIALLRFIVHGRGGGAGDEDYAEQQQEEPRDNRNLIQRWFNRDDDEPQPQG
ncbi:hypothetical protein ACFQ1E_20640 [Sphingomonas canadensis]|uniref:DUF4349 domain-containing protein n=1 Tax=Sphingomonas canadensis TaxID=1219257 RepID=A0ABW3HGS5_9SPHN|nr:hypothetical protein [Sphingomonas canadensis]MCW3838449.1 hypothetical protein [Sphingomonas canadensis]